MPEREKIISNLIDAGVNPETAKTFVKLLEEGNREGAMSLLLKFRKNLLGDVHICQKRLDCLDFLIYTLKKEREENK